MSQDRPPTEEAQPIEEEEEKQEEAPAHTPSPAKDADQLELAAGASSLQKFGFKILYSHTFERLMGAIIMLNFVVVIVETDNNAKNVESADWVWYASWGLLTTFVVELIAKMFVLRSQFWHETWNNFDFCVIAIDSTFSLLEVIGISFLNVSMLRILRLSRLARATKVFRMFPELKLMLAGLTGAVSAIFWGSVLLFVALLVWSVLAVQFIHPLNLSIHEESDVYNGCPRCPRAYESTFQACLTFTTQIVAGDSWGRETQPVIEQYPATAVFFLSVYVSVGLAIMNLILGVVVNVATEARDRLLKEEADEKLLCQDESLSALLIMCQEMDDDGNDELTFEEIREGFDSNEAFRDTLSDMDIGRDDLQIVWTILDSDRSGTVTSKEFVNQIYKMKNSDSQFMLAYIKFYITEIKDKLRGDMSKLGMKMNQDLTHLEEGIGQVETDMDKLDKGMGLVQQEVADVAGSARFIGEQVQKIDANTEIMQTQVAQTQRQVAANTGRIEAELGGGSVCSDYSSYHRSGATPSAIGQYLPTEWTNLMFESGSLKELLENVQFADTGKAPRSKAQFGVVSGDPVEMIAGLENVWKQCIVSIDDMRHFHTSLANLLESIVRRVSMTIHDTVSASVMSSTSKMPGMIRSATQLSEVAESVLSRRNWTDTSTIGGI